MVSGKPIGPRSGHTSHHSYLLFPVTHFNMWEYVLQGNQEYGHVVALQTYILYIGCAYGPAVACGGFDPRVGMKGKRLLRNYLFDFLGV
jgi:hypothetical protein